MRHAHALDGNVDKQRGLSDVGRTAARRMGLHLQHAGLLPRLVLVSTARRCQETLAQIEPLLDKSVVIDRLDDLYLAEDETIAKLIRGVGRGVAAGGGNDGDHPTGPLLVLAHNPGISVAASRWSGRYHSLTPASAVVLDCDVSSPAEADPDHVRHSRHFDARAL